VTIVQNSWNLQRIKWQQLKRRFSTVQDAHGLAPGGKVNTTSVQPMRNIDHGFFNEFSNLPGIENIDQSVKLMYAANPDAIQLTMGQAHYLQFYLLLLIFSQNNYSVDYGTKK